MIREEEVFKIGKFAKPHGIQGELQLTFHDDIFDRVDCNYIVCRMDGILVPFFIEEYRFKSNDVALLKLVDVDSAEAARQFTNLEVFFPIKYIDSDNQELSWDSFVGFKVNESHLGEIGEVVSVDSNTANILFVVEHQGEELLIPAHEEFIEAVDVENKTIQFALPEGMIDINK